MNLRIMLASFTSACTCAHRAAGGVARGVRPAATWASTALNYEQHKISAAGKKRHRKC